MSEMSVVLSAAVERGLRETYSTFAVSLLTELSSAGVLYCSLEKAMKLFNFEDLKLTSKRSVAAKAKRAKELSGKTTFASLPSQVDFEFSRKELTQCWRRFLHQVSNWLWEEFGTLFR